MGEAIGHFGLQLSSAQRGSMDANLAAGFRAQLAELTRLVRGRARQGLCCVLRSRFIRWPARKWPLSFRCKLA